MDSWDPSGGFDWSSLTGAGDPGGGSLPNAGDPNSGDPSFAPGGGSYVDPNLTGGASTTGDGSDPSRGIGVLQQLDTQSGGQFTKLAKQFGILDKNGDVNWLSLASLLGPALGGVLAYHATNKATNQMQQGITNASAAANSLLGTGAGGAGALFQPYQQAGQGALAKLQGMNWTPLAPQYKPLGPASGPNSAFRTLGQVAGGH